MPISIRINDDVVYREVDGEVVALSLETAQYVNLDAIGSEIWRLIEQHGAMDPICSTLMRLYDLDAESCAREVGAFLDMLQGRRLITVMADGR